MGRMRGGGEREAYILTSSVCGFYLGEDVAEVFGQLLCAGGVDLHFFLFGGHLECSFGGGFR
jgi:hypothetical protein